MFDRSKLYMSHSEGYLKRDLLCAFGSDFNKFDRWMYGQTVGITEDNEIYYYPWDVERWINIYYKI